MYGYSNMSHESVYISVHDKSVPVFHTDESITSHLIFLLHSCLTMPFLYSTNNPKPRWDPPDLLQCARKTQTRHCWSAGTASCPVSRHFYHTYILQCNPAGGEDADAQQSPAPTQLHHLWQVGAGIRTALRISTLPTKYYLLPVSLPLSHSTSVLAQENTRGD